MYCWQFLHNSIYHKNIALLFNFTAAKQICLPFNFIFMSSLSLCCSLKYATATATNNKRAQVQHKISITLMKLGAVANSFQITFTQTEFELYLNIQHFRSTSSSHIWKKSFCTLVCRTVNFLLACLLLQKACNKPSQHQKHHHRHSYCNWIMCSVKHEANRIYISATNRPLEHSQQNTLKRHMLWCNLTVETKSS